VSNVVSAKKTGRPRRDTEAVNVRLDRDMLDAIDTFRSEQDPSLSRPEAIRRALLALKKLGGLG
jgi:uncharacterized protein (DUF4415 family)